MVMRLNQHARRKRPSRRRAALSKSQDEDDQSGDDFFWGFYTAVSLILLSIGLVARAVNAALGNVFLALYGLFCVYLFVHTTRVLAREARGCIDGNPLNIHYYGRNPMVRQVVIRALGYPILSLLLYAPSVIVPVLVLRAGGFAYVLLFITIPPLAFGGYTVIRWWHYSQNRDKKDVG